MKVIIVLCFDTWEHRADLLKKVFINDGHDVEIFMSDYRHMEKTRRLEKKKGYRFFSAEPYRKNMSIKRLYSHIQLSRDIFSSVEREVPDLLWVLAPPNSFVKDAAKVKERHVSMRLIIDLIDLWPETMPVGRIKPLLFFWKDIRNKWLNVADLVVTECNLYQKKLEGLVDRRKMITLYLARENIGYEPCLNLPEHKLSLCYLGSINNIIDIDMIQKIIQSIPQSVILHIIGEGEKKNELISAGRKAGAEVIDHGSLYDRDAKQRILDSCHYGLNIMKESVCVGLTMKSMDYFEFGLPIINNICGDTWDIVEKYHCGVNISKDTCIDIKISEREERKKARSFFEDYLTIESFRGSLKKVWDQHEL